MTRDHFSQMYKQSSKRHDQEHPSVEFDKAFTAMCGMLYSVVTLKAFFPMSPAPEMNDNPVKDANGGDQEEQNSL